jgi:hypothetical protein
MVEYGEAALAVMGMVFIEDSKGSQTTEQGDQEFTFWYGAGSIIISVALAAATLTHRYRNYKRSKK